MIDLSVITVTHQSAPFIEDQVFSVIKGGLKASLEQIIVDNCSTDGTVEVLEGLSHLLAKVVKNRGNAGFSSANNQALLSARGRYILFLNPDMCVEEGSLDHLVEWMDGHPEVGISSCLLVDGMGRPQEAGYPRPLPSLKNALLWILRLDRLYTGTDSKMGRCQGDALNLRQAKPARKQINLKSLSMQAGLKCRGCSTPVEPIFESRAVYTGLGEGALVREVESVRGAFMLVRRELVEKLGFAFDPRYFLLYEDTDLCREARRLGYPIVFHADVRCVDFNSRSFATKAGPWIYRCFSEGMLCYFRKWEPWYSWIWIALLIPLGFFLRFPPWKRD
jgi:GT2 family glycosyltransferase